MLLNFKFIAALVLFAAQFSLSAQEKETVLKSPDGELSITFRTNEAKLTYEVEYKNKLLMEPSAMGLELQGSRVLGENVAVTRSAFSQGEDNYRLLSGRTDTVSEKYNAVVLELTEQTGNARRMNVEARAYNDAVAFRYLMPEQKSLTGYQLKNEKTEFRMVKDAIAYALVLPNFKSGYESEFQKTPVSGLANQGGVPSKYLVGLPLLMKVDGVAWAVISEADLESNSAMYLCNTTGSWAGHRFDAVVAPGQSDPEVAVTGKLPHKTAWRIIMVALEPTHFIESNILTSLNPENRIDDVSWITTGKSAWDWWNGSLNREGVKAYTTETMKYYVDFAAESGFEFMTVDAGWSGKDITVCRDNVNIPEVVEYAKKKGVKVIIWLYSENVWNQMDEAFPLYEKWGVAGMKIDFILRDDQAGIDFYYRVAEKAAKHKLLVDFHGCTKPWGLQRTYPNVIGYEAILGMENSLVGVRDYPENRLTAPFTRMIGGLMDYTPGAFDNVTREAFSPRSEKPMAVGTRAHHLAMYVVYESPFQMVSDWPERYKNEPAFEFIRQVPAASWEKTKVLNGKPGEYITVARKKDGDWYLGAMTDWTPREFTLSLDFLENGNYLAEIYADAPDSGTNPKKITIRNEKVKAGGKLNIRMAEAGGAAIRFKKIK
ncbi:MAG: glycoside hydrolase family 97 protein [Tannerella sp.]|jgi:alpha-glucosidase|nr:glycoside hydrolase family 97 protein [Tannerella sp.]